VQRFFFYLMIRGVLPWLPSHNSHTAPTRNVSRTAVNTAAAAKTTAGNLRNDDNRFTNFTNFTDYDNRFTPAPRPS
jgi:hypothetical protein